MMPAPPAAAFSLRRLGSADAVQYRALRLAGLRAFPGAFRPAVDEALEQPLAWAEKRLTTRGEYWFGAFDGIELVGAICLRTQDGAKVRHVASLKALLVDPLRLREGIGAALVAHLIDFARALGFVRQLTLTVIDGNAPAIALYERFGFIQFGLEPDAFFHDGVYHAQQHRQLSLVSPDVSPQS